LQVIDINIVCITCNDRDQRLLAILHLLRAVPSHLLSYPFIFKKIFKQGRVWNLLNVLYKKTIECIALPASNIQQHKMVFNDCFTEKFCYMNIRMIKNRVSMRKGFSVLITLTLLLMNVVTNAQNSNGVKGFVKDESGQIVAGATVTVKNLQTDFTAGTQTDSTGFFNFNGLPDGDNYSFTISNVGYETQTLSKYKIRKQADISLIVKLRSLISSLDQVVVVGYGTTRKKDLTGAVATVSAKDFNRGNYTSPDQLIQGKVSGVQIINNSGQPGGAATIKIRGNSAITGSGLPLFVVDGVPLDNRSARPGLVVTGLGTSPDGNPLNFLNPADIASMEVLKDASATAIYGSRAAYGVVIINTKRGQSGQPKLDVGMSVGVSKIAKRIKMLNAGQYRDAIGYYGVSPLNDLGGDVDALDAILQKGIQQNYTVAVSGGSDAARYRLSAGYQNQDGIIQKSGFKKYNVNFSNNLKFLESKKLGLDFNITSSQYIETIAPITTDAGSTGSLIQHALQWNPTDSLRHADGSLNIKPGTLINPLAMSEAYNDVSKVTTVLGSISPYYKFNKWLEFRMLYSVNYGAGIRRTSIRQDVNIAAYQTRGWAAISNNELVTQQITQTLNFNKEVAKDLNLNALLGYEYMKYSNKGSGISALGPTAGFGMYDLDYTNYLQYSATAGRVISSFIDPTNELQSFFGRAIMNYNDRYLVTATFRADGSSKFGDNNKYGYFPSFSAAWNINKEKFFHIAAISQLKVRAGWGKTGNQEFPAGSSQARYSFTDNGGLGQVNNPNPDLKWQSDKQYNIGVDVVAFNNKVSATIDYFNKTTTDLLFPSAPIQPAPPGSATRWINLDGNIVNKGLEAAVNVAVISRKDFNWDLGANATFISNEVSGLSAPILTGALTGAGLSAVTVEVIQNGLPINSFVTRRFLGIDPATGQSVYEDKGNTFYRVGNPNPKTLLGINSTVRYKKVSLIVNMNGSFGQDIYNNTANSILGVASINGGKNIGLSVYEAAIKESVTNPVTASSRYLENGSYLKLSNATITYNFGNIGKALKGATAFVTGQNLFVITKYTGFDPEVNVNKGVNNIPSLGIDLTPYPTARTFLFGINFSL
jgi:TonB-linked SusC/RagA family outer membrane protein